jgi:hypothetical protein
VLGAENGGQFDPRLVDQPVDHVTERVVDRGVIADDANAGAAQVLGSQQHIGPETH